MSGQSVPIPEERFAREIFGPLGGIVEIGAVVATGTWAVAEASVGELVSRRRDEVDQLLAAVRAIGGFSDASMAIADELGWLRDHEMTAPSLLLWSGGIEKISPRCLEGLEEPSVVRRMCRMGADLQLAHFLQALVSAAIVEGGDARQSAERIVEALNIAVALADDAGRSTAEGTFRTWRVTFLPSILRPKSSAPESGKAGFRAHAYALEELLDD
ncbi:hypothetical protein [Streptomyces sp. NPDC048825]|uniref:hypothetical protein n=1 Tax=Streptomyces sp. NPDC048825 TaxID=3365592 RepID=UPI00371ED0BA